MQTKNIFKTLAFAMLMPTMLLTTACSSEDDVVNCNNANLETVANKGYALPVTVNVTREGDATMRAAFDGSKLNFGEGDKLFVKGNDYSAGGTGFFAGTLTWQSGGTFSGTILTQNAYSGTIVDLFKAVNNPLATLIPANYVNYSYLSFTSEGTYEASVTPNYTKTFATSKATAVEQFSFEVGGYTPGTGFVLHPANAILNFTITGLAASTEFAVALSDGGSFTISGNVTTDDLGTATFAIGVHGGTDLNEFSLTVGGTPITLVSSSKVLAAGKIYIINRSEFTMAADATIADKGKLICTDGHIHANGADNGCTKARVAKIAYLGNDAETSTTYNHGLALALEDVSETKSWCSQNSVTCLGTQYDDSNKFNDMAGIANTDALVNNTGHTHAAKAAREYNSGTHPTGTSAWFLPSAGQWDKMIGATGLGLSNLGLTEHAHYWSSTECDALYAWLFLSDDGSWYSGSRVDAHRVRAVLAF